MFNALIHSLLTFGELKALTTEGEKSSEGRASRMEEKVAMNSPQEVTHLVTGREEIIPFQVPTP